MEPDEPVMRRIASALEKLAAAFDRSNTISEERLKREFPEEKVRRAPEIINTKSEREEQYSDTATEEWMRATEQALATPRPEQPSRFQKRFDESPDKRADPPRRRRAVAVPEGHQTLSR